MKRSIKSTVSKYAATASIATLLLVNPAASYAVTTQEMCESQEQMANTIMQARQTGVPLQRMLDLANGDAVIKAIVRMAFTKPKFTSEKYKGNAADQFANEIYLLCMKNSK